MVQRSFSSYAAAPSISRCRRRSADPRPAHPRAEETVPHAAIRRIENTSAGGLASRGSSSNSGAMNSGAPKRSSVSPTVPLARGCDPFAVPRAENSRGQARTADPEPQCFCDFRRRSPAMSKVLIPRLFIGETGVGGHGCAGFGGAYAFRERSAESLAQPGLLGAADSSGVGGPSVWTTVGGAERSTWARLSASGAREHSISQ
jgi:hypothetical protein